eukprot:TRINITY_DN109_c0_g1_i1.p1 TRINITY_DN109_c0_g1~~TRINITY_DN109_c0_g1_i1.p1  ORF type:complete len:150 (-),score=7.74 TRINITY_DN109_c0_g1_i1:162-611(-)
MVTLAYIAQLSILSYAITLIIGGAMGYYKRRSVPSLIVSFTAAAILILAFVLTWIGAVVIYGFIMAIVIMLAFLVFFAIRYYCAVQAQREHNHHHHHHDEEGDDAEKAGLSGNEHTGSSRARTLFPLFMCATTLLSLICVLIGFFEHVL